MASPAKTRVSHGCAAPRPVPQCIEAAPHLVYGHVAMCISKGRLALFTDNKTKVGRGPGGRQGGELGGRRLVRGSAQCGWD